MSAPRCTAGELPLPQLISHGPKSAARFRVQTRRAGRAVDGDDLTGAEDRVHALAVGHRTGARQIVFVVNGWQLPLRRKLVDPSSAAVDAAERLDHEAHVAIVSVPA